MPHSRQYNQLAIHWRVAQRCAVNTATMRFHIRIHTHITTWQRRIRREAYRGWVRVRDRRVAHCTAQIQAQVRAPIFTVNITAVIPAWWTWAATSQHTRAADTLLAFAPLATANLSAPTTIVCQFRFQCKFQLCHHRRQWTYILKKKLNQPMQQVYAEPWLTPKKAFNF